MQSDLNMIVAIHVKYVEQRLPTTISSGVKGCCSPIEHDCSYYVKYAELRLPTTIRETLPAGVSGLSWLKTFHLTASKFYSTSYTVR